MAAKDRVSLLDARLELTRHLTQDELAELAGVSLPSVVVEPGPFELSALLSTHDAFGATLLDGIVTNALRIGEQTGIQLLGPGDLLLAGSEIYPEWLACFEFRAATPVRLSLFGRDLLAAAYRWPRIVQSLCACVGDQLQRLTAQLVICQLPRVEDRVVGILWLLAESWGHVTPGGVRLPLALTHETIGALIGARRPTVTLALRKLVEVGVVVPQDSGWLLLEPPQQSTAASATVPAVQPADLLPGRWAAVTAPTAADPSVAYAELRETVSRLRAQHTADAEHTREQLMRVRKDRVRILAMRKRIAQDALRRRHPPSS
jgi:hypothetical protein